MNADRLVPQRYLRVCLGFGMELDPYERRRKLLTRCLMIWGSLLWSTPFLANAVASLIAVRRKCTSSANTHTCGEKI